MPGTIEGEQLYCPNPDCPDMRRTGVRGEYRDDIAVCPKCKTELVPAEPADPAPEVPRRAFLDYEEFVHVGDINNTALIPLAKSLLDAASIRYFIKNERTHDLVGYPRFSSGGYNPWWQPAVLVEPGRAEEARALLKDLKSG